MRHVLATLLTGIFLLAFSSVGSALDLGMDKGKVENAESKLKNMATEAEDKVKEAKGEANKQSKGEEIQSKTKERINDKIDDMKSGFSTGNR